MMDRGTFTHILWYCVCIQAAKHANDAAEPCNIIAFATYRLVTKTGAFQWCY